MDHIPMADSIEIGWRNESYLGGDFNHIRVAACVGILTNLSVDSISRIERGERAPSLESIEKISNALKVRMAELFNFDGEDIAALSESPFESLELWKLLKNKRSKQVKKVTAIAKIVLE
jgi:transcriptional regulator with XRE-family HTH domain